MNILFFGLLTAFLNFSMSSISEASLGGDVASVQELAHEIKGKYQESHSSVQLKKFQDLGVKVFIIKNSGLAVTEYMNASGKIFAVTYSGPTRPDMQKIFGAHHTSYLDLDHGVPRVPGRRPRLLSNDVYLIQEAGHPRSFHGRAILKSELPKELDIEDLPW